MDPQYLTDYLPTHDLAYINFRKRPAIYPLDTKTERYCNSFFPYCISQWNNLNSLYGICHLLQFSNMLFLMLYALSLQHISRQKGSRVLFSLLG